MEIFLINLVGLPADLSQEELDKCVQIVKLLLESD